MKLLGEDTAEAVLAHLRPELAETLRANMNRAQSQLKNQQKRVLLKDFESFFDFAIKSMPADLRAVSFDENETQDENGGPAPTAPEPPAPPQLTGDPMTDLELLSVYQLSGALETEQPRTVAILLNNIPPQLAATVLSYFPDEHRAAVARQLSKEQNAPQVLVDRIARATVQRGVTLPPDAPDRRDHLDRLSEVMREVPKSYRSEMLTAIEEENAELSAALLKRLYRFDDLITLDPQVIQQILGEVDATTLTTAMFQADEAVVEAILGNLSRRARQTIEEELQFQTRVPDAKVKAARESVAELIAKLDQESE